MPRKVFKRIIPNPATIKNNRYLKVLGTAMHNSDCWHLTKHSVAGAFFIGVFCAFLPMPFQTVLAGFLAIILKRNLPLSVGLVFISNPITMAPIFYFNYLIGSLFFPETVLVDYALIDDIWAWLSENFSHIGPPLIVGSLLVGLIAGALSYFTIHGFWVWQVNQKWQKRRELRKKKKKKSIKRE